MLNRLKIPYRYEHPLRLGKWIVYPDFTILHVKQRKEIIWEHFGMMDHEAYAEKAFMKIRTYEENGVFPGEKLILTYETIKSPLNQKQILNVIRHYLE